MTELQQSNASAKAAYDNRNYPLAFQTLWNTGIDNFLSYCQKEVVKTSKTNWFSDPKSSDFFWREFILQEHIFISVFQSDLADQFLHNYFSKFKKEITQFETKLAQTFPNVLVNAIRTNQVFLNQERNESLKVLPLSSSFKTHQKVWQRIFETESELWQAIKTQLPAVLKISIDDIIIYSVFWLEEERLHGGSTRQLHHLAYTYSFLIELILSQPSELSFESKRSTDFSTRFISRFTAYFDKSPQPTETDVVSSMLSNIGNWIHFHDEVILPYSFNMNAELVHENELVYLKSTPHSYYKWVANGLRYELNQFQYLIDGGAFVEQLEKEKRIQIPGNTSEDIEANRKLAAAKWSTLIMLNDLSIDSFKLGPTRVPCENVLIPLLTFSFNKLHRYEKSFQTHRKDSSLWAEAFTKIIQRSLTNNKLNEPFLLMTVDDYQSLNKTALPHIIENATEEIINLFCYRPNKKTTFNRFKLKFEVWQTPFVHIGEFLFCPTAFFANNIWFYSFSQAALLQNTDRRETEKMEVQLGELFKNKHWNVKVLRNNEVNELPGDVDIIIEDKESLLFVQLKRTYFRLNLKDMHYESATTERKAAQQLNDAEEYLLKPNSIYTCTKKPLKWIVSTSFERICENISGCYKINYFDLVRALRNNEILYLHQLISYLQGDVQLKSIMDAIYTEELPDVYRQLIYDIVKPLSEIESKHYKIPLFSVDEQRTLEYNNIFDSAMKLDREGKKKGALSLFLKCITLNPNDAEAYEAIANIYADLKQFDKAFPAYTEALKILPDDPFISRNYCKALIESGYIYDGLLKTIELHKMYPILRDVKYLFEKFYEQSIKQGSLQIEQLIELKEKWDSLN